MYQAINFLSVQYQYAIAFISAIASALVITPIITIVDKSIILSANGKLTLPQALLQSIVNLLKPFRMIKSFQFQWVLFVYIQTYIASNISPLLFAGTALNPKIMKLFTTFAVNTVASIIKDKKMAQKLGKPKLKPFPILSIILFFIRDLIAMASAFTIPAILASQIIVLFEIEYQTSLKISQIISPMMIQTINTFIHLFALDLYNFQQKSLIERIKEVKSKYLPSLLVRVIGFTLAYGIGGIVNLQTQNYFYQLFTPIQSPNIFLIK